ncbi:magnesium transporter [Neohortaea acidophila]|uniref:Magnesium transporter n=1 Tax=Neohortaea acidophila TaxID=245834 RepID=A0A6A6Q4G8_9PEZI|nr:magnesium transporter [Neohortaea acidophila]KAF2486856.1 magnesium transporter [Neohortaea acidophila]
MAILASALNIVGLLFLSHAVYSAYEHSLLPTTALIPPTPSRTLIPAFLNPKIDLPLDITLETLFSVVLLCIGVVISSPALMPIQWNVWAGRMERSKEARLVTEVGVGGGNPYAVLEERPGFVDIRRQRREFAEWKGGKGVGL